eukprot:763535-Hanusia_phi.AAC.3
MSLLVYKVGGAVPARGISLGVSYSDDLVEEGGGLAGVLGVRVGSLHLNLDAHLVILVSALVSNILLGPTAAAAMIEDGDHGHRALAHVVVDDSEGALGLDTGKDGALGVGSSSSKEGSSSNSGSNGLDNIAALNAHAEALGEVRKERRRGQKGLTLRAGVEKAEAAATAEAAIAALRDIETCWYHQTSDLGMVHTDMSKSTQQSFDVAETA